MMHQINPPPTTVAEREEQESRMDSGGCCPRCGSLYAHGLCPNCDGPKPRPEDEEPEKPKPVVSQLSWKQQYEENMAAAIRHNTGITRVSERVNLQTVRGPNPNPPDIELPEQGTCPFCSKEYVKGVYCCFERWMVLDRQRNRLCISSDVYTQAERKAYDERQRANPRHIRHAPNPNDNFNCIRCRATPLQQAQQIWCWAADIRAAEEPIDGEVKPTEVKAVRMRKPRNGNGNGKHR